MKKRMTITPNRSLIFHTVILLAVGKKYQSSALLTQTIELISRII
ncbi:hypothetical protein THOG05_240053 [Vibrio rotiferianus]|nr:hypothetical protein THOG05_240053 [Vibrio rotiferianus]CAH1558315.1 hypothetical protein THOE12_190053 [Vibrio rotiferianus]